MRLNLGCGADVVPGLTNVDLRADLGPDVHVCDVTALPAEWDGQCDEIWARSIFEHFPPHRTDEILEHWKAKLKPGGRLYLEVPDMLVLAEMLVERPLDDRGVILNMLGGHRFGPEGEWDCHHTGWTFYMFATLLDRHGFKNIRRLDPRECNMKVEAFK